MFKGYLNQKQNLSHHLLILLFYCQMAFFQFQNTKGELKKKVHSYKSQFLTFKKKLLYFVHDLRVFSGQVCIYFYTNIVMNVQYNKDGKAQNLSISFRFEDKRSPSLFKMLHSV